MGKLEERIDGTFVLEVKVDAVTLTMAFNKSEKPLTEIPEERATDGFYLEIPDR